MEKTLEVNSLSLARMALCMGFLDLAVSLWEKNADRSGVESLWVLGRIEAARGYFEAAVKIFRQALYCQALPRIRYDLGLALHAIGDADASISEFELALQNEPQHASWHAQLGSVLLEKGRVRDALSAFRRSLSVSNRSGKKKAVHQGIHPEFAQKVCTQCATYFLQHNKKALAKMCYEQLLSLSPTYMPAYEQLAVLLGQMGRCDEQKMIAHRGLGLGESATLLSILGKNHKNEPSTASAYFERANLLQKETDVHDLGLCYEELHKYKEAIELIETCDDLLSCEMRVRLAHKQKQSLALCNAKKRLHACPQQSLKQQYYGEMSYRHYAAYAKYHHEKIVDDVRKTMFVPFDFSRSQKSTLKIAYFFLEGEREYIKSLKACHSAVEIPRVEVLFLEAKDRRYSELAEHIYAEKIDVLVACDTLVSPLVLKTLALHPCPVQVVMNPEANPYFASCVDYTIGFRMQEKDDVSALVSLSQPFFWSGDAVCSQSDLFDEYFCEYTADTDLYDALVKNPLCIDTWGGHVELCQLALRSSIPVFSLRGSDPRTVATAHFLEYLGLKGFVFTNRTELYEHVEKMKDSQTVKKALQRADLHPTVQVKRMVSLYKLLFSRFSRGLNKDNIAF